MFDYIRKDIVGESNRLKTLVDCTLSQLMEGQSFEWEVDFGENLKSNTKKEFQVVDKDHLGVLNALDPLLKNIKIEKFETQEEIENFIEYCNFILNLSQNEKKELAWIYKIF